MVIKRFLTGARIATSFVCILEPSARLSVEGILFVPFKQGRT